eukprot:s337_g28.t1
MQDLETARTFWKRISDSILQLESHIRSDPGHGDARSLLADIGTHCWQITREFWAVGRSCGWALNNQELNDMVFGLFATPLSTKQSLESAFNDLKDKGRQAKANKMSPYCRWSYLSLNPFAASGGIRTVKVSDVDFSIAASTDTIKEARELPHFRGVRSACLPTEMPSQKELTERWRPAGFQTNRVAAAAVAFCIQAARVDFARQFLAVAWTGCFLLKRQVYFVKRKGSFVLSCGFFKWASIIIPMNVSKVGDETYLWPDPESVRDAVHWNTGNSFEDMDYVPTEVLPPCAMPVRLLGRCCVARVTGEPEHVMRPAFRT